MPYRVKVLEVSPCSHAAHLVAHLSEGDSGGQHRFIRRELNEPILLVGEVKDSLAGSYRPGAWQVGCVNQHTLILWRCRASEWGATALTTALHPPQYERMLLDMPLLAKQQVKCNQPRCLLLSHKEMGSFTFLCI